MTKWNTRFQHVPRAKSNLHYLHSCFGVTIYRAMQKKQGVMSIRLQNTTLLTEVRMRSEYHHSMRRMKLSLVRIFVNLTFAMRELEIKGYARVRNSP